MCTLIAVHRSVPGAFLVVAANRDEYLDRPAEGPALRESPEGPIVAPRDCRAGGTWLGINRGGVFAAVTNRPCAAPSADARSRGLLVQDALSAASAEDAATQLAGLAAGAYNPFNCLVADSERAFVAVYDDHPQVEELAPGVHVVGNADPNDERVPKVARIRQRAVEATRQPFERILPGLAEVCAEHVDGGNPRDDTCVHLAGTYGTRSSSLIVLGEEAADSRFLYADGAPCKTPYQDFTSLLHEQSRWAGYGATGPALRKAN